MNFKTTIILFVLLVITGTVALFTGRGSEGPVQQAAVAPGGAVGQKLLDVQSDHVTLLMVVDPDGSRARVQKDKDMWRVTEPVTALGSDSGVASLISALIALRSQGRPSGDIAADTGLDHPRYMVEVDTDDGNSYRLAIGNKTSLGDQIYARVNNGDVNLIDTSIEKTLKTAADDIHDKRLATIVPADEKQFQITYGGQTLRMAKIKGKWWLHQINGPDVPGDAASINALLSAINDIRASEFVKRDSDKFQYAGFDHPTMLLWVSTSPEPINSAAPKPASTAPTLPRFRPQETAIMVGAPDSLTKEHYFFQTADALTGTIAASTLDGFKKSILDLRDREVLTVSEPVRTIAVEKQIFPTTQPTTQAMTGGGPVATPMVVPMEQVILCKRSHKPMIDSRLPMPMPELMPAGRAATRAATQPTTRPATPESQWELASDPKAQVDDAKVQVLLAQFQPLRAQKYLEKSPASPTARHYIVDVTTVSGSICHLEVTKPAGEGEAYGVYGGLTFEVASDFVDALDADFKATVK